MDVVTCSSTLSIMINDAYPTDRTAEYKEVKNLKLLNESSCGRPITIRLLVPIKPTLRLFLETPASND